MIPATTEDIAAFARLVATAPFGAALAPQIEPYANDPVPPVNARGGRGAEGWRMVFQGTVMKEWCNGFGSMHGAAASWVVDTCTSAALVPLSTPVFWGPPMLAGVSVTLDMSYFNPAPAGTRVRIVVLVERMSPTLANLRCDITEWDTGKRICSGTHCKAWRPGPKSKEGNEGKERKEGQREAKM